MSSLLSYLITLFKRAAKPSFYEIKYRPALEPGQVWVWRGDIDMAFDECKKRRHVDEVVGDYGKFSMHANIEPLHCEHVSNFHEFWELESK